MGTRFDNAWLVEIQQRVARNEPWQPEVAEFLRSTRTLARVVIAKTRRAAIAGGWDEDIIALAESRFVMKGIAAYRAGSSPQTYYCKIVTRTAISFLNPKRWTHERPSDPEAIERQAGAAPAEAARVDLGHDILVALRELSDDDREAVILYHMEEFGTDAACAARVGIDEEAFRKRRERGKAVLRERMKEYRS